jgi:aarF domain-containing kinase
MVEEFGGLLEGQLDLREEAANLARFNENFKTNQYGVRFPRSIDGFTERTSKHVMIEEFIEGVPVMQWADTHDDKILREQMSRRGIQAVCKMIFQDNFLHGDLHPGNVLISSDNEIVMLDVGITKVFAKRDHDLLVKVLTCFIRSNGRAAALHMAENSDFRLGSQSNPEDLRLFADKIEEMVVRAKTDESFFGSLGSYFTAICDAASSHRVKMNQGFISMALAVKVVEGIALELDPKIEVWAIANPMILEGTASRKWSETFNELVNFWLPDIAHTEWSFVKGLFPSTSAPS